MILHIVNRSPFNSAHLDNCLEIITPSDAMLLMDDGVYAVNGSQIQNLPFSIYAIENDILARGLNKEHKGIELINHEQMVDLVAQYPLSKTWF